MIPDYPTYFRYQDKRLIPHLFLITFILLSFYWKNRGFTLSENDAVSLSVVLSLIVFNFISEIKSNWAYKFVVNKIDPSTLRGKPLSQYQSMLLHPVAIGVLGLGIFYLMASSLLKGVPPGYALSGIAIVAPVMMYLMFRFTRLFYMKKIEQAFADKVKYRSLHRYVGARLLPTLLMSILVISPLGEQDDFAMSEGIFSARLMVAMLILCVVVLSINLVFSNSPRRYALLGRMFLNEIDLNFSAPFPMRGLYEMPLWLRLMILLLCKFIWILVISATLALSGWDICFDVYYVLCLIPSIIYYYLHVYWRWHNDYMMACDMYLRWGIIHKQTSLW